jgi:hypothetical protein
MKTIEAGTIEAEINISAMTTEDMTATEMKGFAKKEIIELNAESTDVMTDAMIADIIITTKTL